MKEILVDRKVILGIGIGFIIAALLILIVPKPQISEDELIKRARDRGMIFKDEVKALY
jgi:hypothetical protein